MRYFRGFTKTELRQKMVEWCQGKNLPVKKTPLLKGEISDTLLILSFLDITNHRTPRVVKRLFPQLFMQTEPPASYDQQGIPWPGSPHSPAKAPSRYWVICKNCRTAHSREEAKSGNCLSCGGILSN